LEEVLPAGVFITEPGLKFKQADWFLFSHDCSPALILLNYTTFWRGEEGFSELKE
jgi:hypothetical protein